MSDWKNPFKTNDFSPRYFRLLNKRKKLPVWERRDDFMKLLDENNVLVLEGETDSGKSTQIPQWCAEYLKAKNQNRIIACTQPKQIAAESLAKHVAKEVDVNVGDEVGFRDRFVDETSENTMLIYMTDDTLVAEYKQDHLLLDYGIIILDECHERTVNNDILMALIKGLTTEKAADGLYRPALKLIVMGTMFNSRKFTEYFNGAPLLSIPSRQFDVETFYYNEKVDDYVELAARSVIQIHMKQNPGHILVFLPGQKGVEDCCANINRLAEDYGPEVSNTLRCYPLYSALPPNLKTAVLDPAPSGVRKCIVATNAAASLTIDSVVFVIDSGLSKQKIYYESLPVDLLAVCAINQASAEQRKGIAGRACPGKCYRLYKEIVFEKYMLPVTPPEVLRINLCGVVILLLRLGVKDLVKFDFMDPPTPDAMKSAIDTLINMGIVLLRGTLLTFSNLGDVVAKFPLAPELALMLIESWNLGCTNEILSIVSMLSATNCFIKPIKPEKDAAEHSKSSFVSTNSDHIMLLNVYNEFIKREPQEEPRMDWCKKNYVHYRSLVEAEKIRNQLENILCNVSKGRQFISDNLEVAIRKALLSGLYMKVAKLCKLSSDYSTVYHNQVANISTDSVSCKSQPKPEWIVFNEVMAAEDGSVKLMIVTEIKPEWLAKFSSSLFYKQKSFPDCDTTNELNKIFPKLKRSETNIGFRSGLKP